MLTRILVRLRPLLRPWVLAVWGLFLWAWSILAEVHLAAFVYEQWGRVSNIVHAHPSLVLLATIVCLVLVAIWPEIKHLVPKLPKTLHERVHAMTELHAGFEERIKIGEENQNIFRHWINETQERNSGCEERLSKLEKWTATGVATTDTVHELVTRTVGLDMQLTEHRMWLNDLQSDVRDTKSALLILKNLFESRLANSLVIDARSRFGSLAPAQKQVIKIVYNQPGLSVKDVADSLVTLGIEETAQTIRAARETNFLRPATGEQLYPTDSILVAGEIEQLLKASGN